MTPFHSQNCTLALFCTMWKICDTTNVRGISWSKELSAIPTKDWIFFFFLSLTYCLYIVSSLEGRKTEIPVEVWSRVLMKQKVSICRMWNIFLTISESILLASMEIIHYFHWVLFCTPYPHFKVTGIISFQAKLIPEHPD